MVLTQSGDAGVAPYPDLSNTTAPGRFPFGTRFVPLRSVIEIVICATIWAKSERFGGRRPTIVVDGGSPGGVDAKGDAGCRPYTDRLLSARSWPSPGRSMGAFRSSA